MPGLDKVIGTSKSAAKWALRETFYRDAVFDPRPADIPFIIRIDLSNVCNQGCVMCHYPEYATRGIPKNFISVEDFAVIAEKSFPYAYNLQIACVFEPLVHPDFDQLIRIADRYDNAGLGLVTNGTLLRGKHAEALAESRNVETLSISIDGISPDVYSLMRGRPHLDQVKGNIADFQERKRALGKTTPRLKFNTVITCLNMDDLPKLLAWCLDHDIAEIEFSHCQPFLKSNELSALNDVAKWNRIHDELGRIALGASMRVFLPPPFAAEYGNYDPETGEYLERHCQEAPRSEFDSTRSHEIDESLPDVFPKNIFCICPWMLLIVDCWGNVYPCTFRTADPPIGNLVRQPLYDVINSMKNLKLRQSLLEGRKEGACANCTARTPNTEPFKRRPGSAVEAKV